MKRILVVNPNTSSEMTEDIRHAAVDAAEGRAEIVTLQPPVGPASIEGQYDEVVSAYWSLDAVLCMEGTYEGYVVACYSNHPLIGALREARSEPVVGIMEASILQGLSLGNRFSIVTTSPRWKPLLEEAVHAFRLEGRCASVRSSGLAVLDLERLPEEQLTDRLVRVAQQAIDEDGAEVICLGCAGMSGLRDQLRARLTVPVLDGVQAAVLQVLDLISGSLTTSRQLLYEPVLPRDADGLPEGIARGYAEHRTT